MLKNRIRRLCTTCRTVPISQHQIPPQHFRTHLQEPIPLSFTAPAFLRTPCTCEDAVWLCHQCGYTLRNNDVIYRRVWGWRTRYSTSLDGLGTGIGEGSQGIKCGRGEDCLAAQEIELEVVSEADDDGPLSGSIGSSTNHTPASNPDDGEPGYFRQEIVGIGGRFKQKVKKRVTVGACVVEHEDERETGRYLTREEEGKHRSWCGWCWRVIPARCEG